MINKETIISVFDDKLTLMQWLKKVENALNGAVLTGVELKKKGNATFAWSFDFEDGTHVDTDYATINEGESVAEAYLLNGHLMIKLTNDEVIDAGNLKPVTSFSFNEQRHLIVNYGDGTTQDLGLIKGVSSFSIDANQHLIVNYDNGTTQDLGAIFSGNLNINGIITANVVDGLKVTGDEIVEKMSGYGFIPNEVENLSITTIYAGVVKNGNKLTIVQFGKITRTGTISFADLGTFFIPSSVADKLNPTPLGVVSGALSSKVISFFDSPQSCVDLKTMVRKGTNSVISTAYGLGNLTLNTEYQFRIETTFLLSDNMAGQ